MGKFEEILAEVRLDVPNVSNLVDSYSIYSYYLGFEPEIRTRYSSPLRKGDLNPSFSLYFSKYNDDILMFKDSATGKYGGVFKFVGLLLGLDLRETLLQINSDFELGLAGTQKGDFKRKIVKILKLVKTAVKIGITARSESKEYIKFWDALDISKIVRDLYFTREVALIHFENPDFKSVITPKSLCISYEINGFYKTYQPKGDKMYKFRNDYPTNYVEGLVQFKFEKEFSIITKATKDAMFYRQHFDFDTCAGTSENTMISPYVMETHLKGKFKRVYIMLDSDEPGLAAQLKYVSMYPWLIPVVLPNFYGEKDLTDAYISAKRVGEHQKVLDWVKETFI